MNEELKQQILTLINKQKESFKELDLTNTEIYDEDLPVIVAALNNNPHITTLVLKQNTIYDAGAATLSQLEHITKIDLSTNSLTNDAISDLLTLKNLTMLNLNDNAFNGNALSALFDHDNYKNCVVLCHVNRIDEATIARAQKHNDDIGHVTQKLSPIRPIDMAKITLPKKTKKTSLHKLASSAVSFPSNTRFFSSHPVTTIASSDIPLASTSSSLPQDHVIELQNKIFNLPAGKFLDIKTFLILNEKQLINSIFDEEFCEKIVSQNPHFLLTLCFFNIFIAFYNQLIEQVKQINNNGDYGDVLNFLNENRIKIFAHNFSIIERDAEKNLNIVILSNTFIVYFCLSRALFLSKKTGNSFSDSEIPVTPSKIRVVMSLRMERMELMELMEQMEQVEQMERMELRKLMELMELMELVGRRERMELTERMELIELMERIERMELMELTELTERIELMELIERMELRERVQQHEYKQAEIPDFLSHYVNTFDTVSQLFLRQSSSSASSPLISVILSKLEKSKDMSEDCLNLIKICNKSLSTLLAQSNDATGQGLYHTSKRSTFSFELQSVPPSSMPDRPSTELLSEHQKIEKTFSLSAVPAEKSPKSTELGTLSLTAYDEQFPVKQFLF